MSKILECSNCGAVMIIPDGKYTVIVRGLTVVVSSAKDLDDLIDHYNLDEKKTLVIKDTPCDAG